MDIGSTTEDARQAGAAVVAVSRSAIRSGAYPA